MQLTYSDILQVKGWPSFQYFQSSAHALAHHISDYPLCHWSFLSDFYPQLSFSPQFFLFYRRFLLYSDFIFIQS